MQTTKIDTKGYPHTVLREMIWSLRRLNLRLVTPQAALETKFAANCNIWSKEWKNFRYSHLPGEPKYYQLPLWNFVQSRSIPCFSLLRPHRLSRDSQSLFTLLLCIFCCVGGGTGSSLQLGCCWATVLCIDIISYCTTTARGFLSNDIDLPSQYWIS